MSKAIDHQQRLRDISEIAMRMFSQVGYENVSLLMIAAAAGVPRTALYNYFKDKREVLDASILSVTGRIADNCKAIVTERLPTPEKLERVCHTVADVMFDNKDFLIAVFDFVIGMVRIRHNMAPSIDKFTVGTRNIIRRLLEQGRRDGSYSPQLDIAATADVIYSEFESCAMRIVLGTEKNSKMARRRFTAIVKTLTLATAR